MDDKCVKCGYETPRANMHCIHCYWPMSSGTQTDFIPEYPNTRDAEQEREDLDLRIAVTTAKIAHDAAFIADFESFVGHAHATINRWIDEVYRIVMHDESSLITTFEKQLAAGMRIWNRKSKWTALRVHAEVDLFPGYGDEIRYALLSPTRRGLPRYGDCSIVLRDDMIEHRATVFESNTAAWWERMTEAFGRALPRGYRAHWRDRARLAYVKLAETLKAPLTEDAVTKVLLAEGPDEADTFIEVNIFGSLTPRSAEEFTVPKAYEGSPLYDNVREKLESMGVTFQGV